VTVCRNDWKFDGPKDIVLDAGGDHQFDLGHLRREGAIRLIQILLQTAGYRKQMSWHVRVEKKITCNAETRPVTVVGAKPWCCYLKIKPGDNNTAHFCSLLMPDGYRGETVYEALKDAEEQVSRVWRGDSQREVSNLDDNQPIGDLTAARQAAAYQAARLLLEPPTEGGSSTRADPGNTAKAAIQEISSAALDRSAALAEESDEGGPSELLGWSHDPDRVRLTLLAIHEVSQEGKAKRIDDFVTILSGKLGWQGLRRKQIGGIFTAMARRGCIQRVYRGSVAVGYVLTPEGGRLIAELLPAAATSPLPAGDALSSTITPPQAASAEPDRLMTALSEIVQKYTTASAKLEANQARRAQLLAEVERLDAEASELGRFVNNPEVKALLERLVQLTESTGSVSQPLSGRPDTL
jgi:hypothetical protein